ncbi:MAG: hypothetical protein ABI315_01435 [Bacteroidia bacterium]
MNKLVIGIFLLAVTLQGCTFETVEPKKAIIVKDSISYSKTIAPITEAKCNDCHSANGPGTGDFTTYVGLKEKADDNSIYNRIETLRDMPTSGSGYELTDTERNDFIAWIKQGAKNN